MRRERTWNTDPVTRVARGLWPDRNPLRRTSDRAEAAMVALLIAAFLMLERRRLGGWEIDWRTSDLNGPAGASPGR